MARLFSKVTAVFVFTAIVISTAGVVKAAIDPAEGCYLDNTNPGFRIPAEDLENSTGGYGLCKEGWYCPFYNPANESATWPRICPPSDACVERRIANQFCEPQGPFEPTPCSGGNYCPTSNTMLRCPDGHFCPLGSTKPHKCSAFAYCPSGTSNEYDMVGIFVVILVDLALAVAFFMYRRTYRASVSEDQDKVQREEEMTRVNTDAEEGGGGGRTNTNFACLTQSGTQPKNNLQPLFSLFAKAKAGGSSITFRFSDLSVKIPAADVAQGGSSSSSAPAPVDPASPHEHGSPKGAAAASPIAQGGGGSASSQPPQKEDKTLLRGVNGKFRPKTVTAIMGPSGAGKTVLLNTLLNKNASSWKQEGDLHVNHTLSVSDIRHVVGFVPQDDVLHPELTVEQNLFYSSETRLPESFTPEDRAQLRSEIIKVLGLTHARHVQIGDESSRGVSGGQRKRCSIGVELAACPSALFLDEPTTGLDAATALDLCSLLQRLSIGTESTIVMVVHQPRVEIWNALDQVLLLAPGGRTVFQGAQADAKAYFQGALGLDFAAGNPADIILDGIAAQADLAVEMWDARMQLLNNGGGFEIAAAIQAPPVATVDPNSQLPEHKINDVEQQPGQVDETSSPQAAPVVAGGNNNDTSEHVAAAAISSSSPTAVAVTHTSQSPKNREHMRSPSAVYSNNDHQEDDEGTKVNPNEPAVIPPHRGASFGKQVYLAMHRQFVKINSHLVASMMDVLLATVCCIVMATAKIREEYIGIIDGAYALLGPKHKMYTLPMICMFYMLAIASGVAPGGIRTFGSGMTLYWREASNGHNKLAYFLGYSIVDLIRTIVSSLHFATIAYLMAEPLQGFWIFWLWILFLFIIVDSQSAALSMFLKPDTAPILSTIVAIFMGLMNGYANIPVIGPASYAWWATEGIMAGEMKPIKNIWSVDILEQLAPGGWNLDQVNVDIAVLIVIYLVYRLVAFLLLVGLNREKQR